MSETDAAYLFLSGAEMAPESIVAAHPGARFVARARLAGSDDTTDIWGIVLRLPAPSTPHAAPRHDVTTDDGRTLAAQVSTDGHPTGDPAAVLAAAKYWELPPAFVSGLAKS